jgi:hypothetical protein
MRTLIFFSRREKDKSRLLSRKASGSCLDRSGNGTGYPIQGKAVGGALMLLSQEADSRPGRTEELVLRILHFFV